MAFLKKKDVTLNDLVSEKDNPNVDILDVNLNDWVGYFVSNYKKLNKDNYLALKGDYEYFTRDDVLKLMLSTLSDLMLIRMLEINKEDI